MSPFWQWWQDHKPIIVGWRVNHSEQTELANEDCLIKNAGNAEEEMVANTHLAGISSDKLLLLI